MFVITHHATYAARRLKPRANIYQARLRGLEQAAQAAFVGLASPFRGRTAHHDYHALQQPFDA